MQSSQEKEAILNMEKYKRDAAASIAPLFLGSFHSSRASTAEHIQSERESDDTPDEARDVEITGKELRQSYHLYSQGELFSLSSSVLSCLDCLVSQGDRRETGY